MRKSDDLSRCLTTLDPETTLIVVVEMSLASWLVAGIVPGVERQPLKKLATNADSGDVGRGFRSKPATCSDRSRPPIPGMSATPLERCSRVGAVDTIWRC